jgi:hypothetical protein
MGRRRQPDRNVYASTTPRKVLALRATEAKYFPNPNLQKHTYKVRLG